VRASDVERFYSHVLKGPDPDSCWLWLGAISDDGYGRFWIGTPNGQRAVATHRFALVTVHGRLAAIEGSIAMHWCDVPLCVRATLAPSTHLLLGTASENMADRALKKRMPSPQRGEVAATVPSRTRHPLPATTRQTQMPGLEAGPHPRTRARHRPEPPHPVLVLHSLKGGR
jgi:hypothetical protein